MKRKLYAVLCTVMVTILMTACGQDPELTAFHADMETFCTKLTNIDTAINSIDPQKEDAVDELLGKLDELDLIFAEFAKMDFPEEFDYLEPVAAESGDYMTEAVKSYHDAYSNGSYNEYTAAYARENYYRAYKRVQIIISFLHGETPEDVNVE